MASAVTFSPRDFASRNERHAPRGARVREVVARADVAREHEVAGHDVVLGDAGPALEAEAGGHGALVHQGAPGEPVVLGVLDHHHAEGRGVLQRAAHHGAVGDAAAVVAHRDAARVAQVGHLRELPALLPAGDRPDGVHPHHAVLAGLGHDHLGDGPVVVHRAGVGHRADPGEAARGRGAGARHHVFFVLVPGLSEVGVEVHEAWHHPAPLAGDHHGVSLRALGRGPRAGAYGDHPRPLDDHVRDLVAPLAGVHHPSASQHRLHRGESFTPDARL